MIKDQFLFIKEQTNIFLKNEKKCEAESQRKKLFRASKIRIQFKNIGPYLDFVVNDKYIGHMLKTRTGNHTLFAEVDRYQNRKRYEEYSCKSCEQQEIGDLFHVIIIYPKYSDFREKTLPFMINIDSRVLYKN